MIQLAPVVFRLDIDKTLLNNDRIIVDFKQDLTQAFGAERHERYRTIFVERRTELGYEDYLGALLRYRVENPGNLTSCISTFTCWNTRSQKRLRNLP